MYDVMQLLKKYGTVIYTKNRLVDLEMMEDEIRELYQLEIIDVKTFQQAILLIRNAKSEVSNG